MLQLRAKPWLVIRLLLWTPIAQILLSPTQTPVCGDLFALKPNPFDTQSMTVCVRFNKIRQLENLENNLALCTGYKLTNLDWINTCSSMLTYHLIPTKHFSLWLLNWHLLATNLFKLRMGYATSWPGPWKVMSPPRFVVTKSAPSFFRPSTTSGPYSFLLIPIV